MTIEEQLANITARLTALERRDIPPVCDVEKEFGINPIPANEGDSRAAESVAIPAGWVECKGHYPSDSRQILHPKTRHIIAWASPNRCVPWGEGYEAILPEDAKRGDEYLAGPEWVAPLDPSAWSASARMAEVWRRKVHVVLPNSVRSTYSDAKRLHDDEYARTEIRCGIARCPE